MEGSTDSGVYYGETVEHFPRLGRIRLFTCGIIAVFIDGGDDLPGLVLGGTGSISGSLGGCPRLQWTRRQPFCSSGGEGRLTVDNLGEIPFSLTHESI